LFVYVDIGLKSQSRRIAHEVGPPSCRSDADCKNCNCPPQFLECYWERNKCTCGNWSKLVSTNKIPSPILSFNGLLEEKKIIFFMIVIYKIWICKGYISNHIGRVTTPYCVVYATLQSEIKLVDHFNFK